MCWIMWTKKRANSDGVAAQVLEKGMLLKVKVATNFGVDVLSQDKLSPEEKVNLAIGMTDVCVRVCADAVRYRNRALREDEVIERVRERIMYAKRRVSGV